MIFAEKTGIKLERVNVIISSPDNDVIEYGMAHRNTINGWGYQSKLATPSPYTSYRIMVTATDATDQSVDTTILAEANVSS